MRGVWAPILRADAGQPVAEYAADPVDHIGLPRQRAAGQHVDRIGADPLDLLRQRLGERDAVDHPLHRRVAMVWIMIPCCMATISPFGLQNASSAAISLRSPSKSAAIRS